MKKAVYIVVFLVIALSIGGYLVFNYAADKVLHDMIPSEEGITPDVTFNISDKEQKASTQEQVQQLHTDSAGSSSSSVKSDGGDGPIQLQKMENSIGGSKQNKLPQVSEHSGNNDIQEMNPTQGMKYSPEVSQNKAKLVEQSITTKEKAQILSVLIRKLSTDELQLFMKMAGNGVSIEEKKEAKKIILKRLTEDEYNQLISIAAKYGLSQGKSYKDSKKE